MPTTQSIAPAVEPVSLTACKLHLRVDHATDDTLISNLISAARLYAETFTGRQIVTATWTMTMDRFPAIIRPPHPMLQSVSSIVYVDDDGDTQTLSASLYTADTASTPGRVEPAFGEVWPGTRSQSNAVAVTYVAGYGTVAATTTTVVPGTELWTAASHGLSTGSAVKFSTATTLPAPVVADKRYYVNVADADTYKIYPSRADAIAETNGYDITTAGTGAHTVTGVDIPEGLIAAINLLVAHWYEHREGVTEGQAMSKPPMAVETLLWQYRIE